MLAEGQRREQKASQLAESLRRNLKKLKVLGRRVAFAMDDEEVAKLYCMRELKILAKKYGIATRRVSKIDIVKAFPPGVLAELKSR